VFSTTIKTRKLSTCWISQLKLSQEEGARLSQDAAQGEQRSRLRGLRDGETESDCSKMLLLLLLLVGEMEMLGRGEVVMNVDACAASHAPPPPRVAAAAAWRWEGGHVGDAMASAEEEELGLCDGGESDRRCCCGFVLGT
jgi:hypothetical protein